MVCGTSRKDALTASFWLSRKDKPAGEQAILVIDNIYT